jgi:hypothetical protein
MRVLLALLLGFIVATGVVIALEAAGLTDPAAKGLAHLLIWAVVAWSVLRSIRKPPSLPTVLNGSSEAADTVDENEWENNNAYESHPPHRQDSPHPELPDKNRRAARGVPPLAVLAIAVAAVVAGGLGGVWVGTTNAAPAARTTTTTTLPAWQVQANTIRAWDDLSDVQRTWCSRDTQTAFAMLRAAEELGFHEFTKNLFDWRDNGGGSSIRRDLTDWRSEKGNDVQDQELAYSCAIAFEAAREAG